jgi:hypothetical protein
VDNSELARAPKRQSIPQKPQLAKAPVENVFPLLKVKFYPQTHQTLFPKTTITVFLG